jgi:hypothetical protein
MRLIDRNRGIITTKVLMGNVSKNTYNITTNFNNTFNPFYESDKFKFTKANSTAP